MMSRDKIVFQETRQWSSFPSIVIDSHFLSDVAYFSGALAKYTEEHKVATEIYESREIGMMLVDAKKLKDTLIPSPLRCLEVNLLRICYNFITFILFM